MTDSPVMDDPRGLPNDTSKQVFDDWDTNDDGFIDPDEVTTVCMPHRLTYTKGFVTDYTC